MIPNSIDLLAALHDSAYEHPENDKENLEKTRSYLDWLEQVKEPRNVLDHGFVRLVDYMGDDLAIVRAARVSYNADWRAGDEAKDNKLIAYLLRNQHTSPFESVLFTFEIKCPLFVTAQWHRHRTWKYNQVSARYTELPEEFYIPTAESVGKQSDKNKQMRDMQDAHHPSELAWANEQIELMRDTNTEAFKVYKALLLRGVPRELARSVLPVATYTRFFATVDLHNLFHFLRLRLHPHAQYEIRVYAVAILDIIRNVCPVAVAAFEESLTEVTVKPTQVG